MAIPDSLNFTLQDVVDEISPSSNTLRTCFDESDPLKFDESYVPDGFDPHASTKTGYRLSYFRNYGINTLHARPRDGDGSNYDQGYIIKSGSDWSTVRNAGSGDSYYVYDYLDGETLEANLNPNHADGYMYRRAYMAFDVTAITDYINLKEAKIVSDNSTIWNDGVVVVKGTQGQTLTADDFDQFNASELYMSYNTLYNGYDAVYAANDTELQRIEDIINNTSNLLVVCIMAPQDMQNATPTRQAGWVGMALSYGYPYLELKYK